MNGRRYGRYVIGLVVVAVALLATAAPAMAASSVTVNAQVEPAQYSIALYDGSNLDYGTLDCGENGLPLDAHVIGVTNIGTEDVQLSMVANDDASNGTNDWQINDFVSADQYVWTVTQTFGMGSQYTLGTVAVTIDDSLPKGDWEAFSSRFYMPSSTTGTGHYYWSGTIYASAPII